VCLITEHAHLKKKVAELETEIAELQETLGEYHEIIETGWDYPEVTLRLPKSRDIVPKADITYSNKELKVRNLPEVWIANVADTLSEDPFFGKGHNVILAKLPQAEEPYRYEDLAVGDMAIYQAEGKYIIHRIVDIKEDAQGRVYTFRGDNTSVHDPYLVRDEHIKYLMLGVIY